MNRYFSCRRRASDVEPRTCTGGDAGNGGGFAGGGGRQGQLDRGRALECENWWWHVMRERYRLSVLTYIDQHEQPQAGGTADIYMPSSSRLLHLLQPDAMPPPTKAWRDSLSALGDMMYQRHIKGGKAPIGLHYPFL
jgi:hypothetical protein